MPLAREPNVYNSHHIMDFQPVNFNLAHVSLIFSTTCAMELAYRHGIKMRPFHDGIAIVPYQQYNVTQILHYTSRTWLDIGH